MSKCDKIDKLLETPCYIIDVLPERVPGDSGGQRRAVFLYR